MFGMVTAVVVQPVEGYDPADDPVAPTNWRWGDTAEGDAGAADEADAEVADG